MASLTLHFQNTARLCVSLVFSLGLLCSPRVWSADSTPAGGETNGVFRMAFTAGMFTEVNENDARAALKVWIMAVAQERNIAVDPDIHILRTLDELTAFCRTNPVDGIGMLTTDYAQLRQKMRFDRLGVAAYGERTTEEYLLLVHRDSHVERLEQLRGATLKILNTPQMSLATLWLDTLLLEAGLKAHPEFFSQVTRNNKASLVTLPVFFHQAGACLVTRSSFNVMGELNPQLASQLRIVAASPPVIPVCFAFRADEKSPVRPEILNEMMRLSEWPAGRQILTLVKSDRVVERPVSSLDSSLELIAKHERLCASAKNSAAAQIAGNANATHKE